MRPNAVDRYKLDLRAQLSAVRCVYKALDLIMIMLLELANFAVGRIVYTYGKG